MTSGLKLNVFMPNRQYISNIYSTIVVYRHCYHYLNINNLTDVAENIVNHLY